MKDRILPKSQLAEYLDRLMKTATVIAPVEQEGENFSLYQPLSRGEQASLKYLKPLRSAKEVFFPQNEDLFYFVQRNQHSVEPLIPTGDTVLFGVPPCDLRVSKPGPPFRNRGFSGFLLCPPTQSNGYPGSGVHRTRGELFLPLFRSGPLRLPSGRFVLRSR
jgi:hypothetical protein